MHYAGEGRCECAKSWRVRGGLGRKGRHPSGVEERGACVTIDSANTKTGNVHSDASPLTASENTSMEI